MTPVTESKTVEVKIDPRDITNEKVIRKAALKKAGFPNSPEIKAHVVRRSIDARSRRPQFVCQVQLGEAPEEQTDSVFCPEKLTGKRVAIIGAGPAGYFAALTLLEKGIKLLYACQTRVDTIVNNPEIIKKMKKAGFVAFFLGIESIHQKSLDYMGKKVTQEQIKKAIDMCHEVGIMA